MMLFSSCMFLGDCKSAFENTIKTLVPSNEGWANNSTKCIVAVPMVSGLLASTTYMTALTRPDSTKEDQIGAMVPPISRTVTFSSGSNWPASFLI